MSDRKSELEEKKRKLEEIRASKRNREQTKRNVEHSSQNVPNAADLRTTTDELLMNLGIPTEVTPAVNNVPEPGDGKDGIRSKSRRRKNLQLSGLSETNIPPPETIIYSKETQTLELPDERESRQTDYYVLTYEHNSREDVDANEALEELQKMPHVGLNRQSRTDSIFGAVSMENAWVGEDALKKVVRLSEEEKNQIITSDEFAQFFDRSARVLERALATEDDFFFEYCGVERESEKSDGLLTVSNTFYDERWSKRRTITSLDWSNVYPELLLAAYRLNDDVSHEQEGVCMMWNMKYPKKTSPEYLFHCQSAVTSATLSRFHPNLVIGGTYSGQVVLWDSRVNKRTPVQRSPLTSNAHTQPVFAITLVGTQNAHHIISLASDGSLCSWNLEMLSQPREKTRVCELASGGGLFDVYPTCMSFFANDVNNYAVGAENGHAYCGQRHSSRTGTVDDVSRHVPYKGHSAPVTSIATHPSPGAMSFSPLFITTSLDWTVRLWSSQEYKPLHKFDDYFENVYDANWSPVHPAVFASVDGAGQLDLWNINEDFETPTARRVLTGADGSDGFSSGTGVGALNRCSWDVSGTHIAAGDDQGRVFVCSVHESLSQPGQEQWSELARTLLDLKQYNMEPDTRVEV